MTASGTAAAPAAPAAPAPAASVSWGTPPTSPVGDTVQRVLDLHAALAARPDLAPGPQVDGVFTDLVRLCTAPAPPRAAPVLDDPRVRRIAPDLRRLCSDGEALLERHWARRLLAAQDADAELARFPYLGNYAALTRLEVHALVGAGARLGAGSRVCFLGGGPLPLSALFLHRALGLHGVVVDRDPVATRLAAAVLHRLAPGGDAPPLTARTADATHAAELARVVPGCDVVVVAALVGATATEKRAALRAVGAALDPGAWLVVRSAEGLRSLLYPVVAPELLGEAGCPPELVVHPLGEVVNSVLVGRRRPDAGGAPAAPPAAAG